MKKWERTEDSVQHGKHSPIWTSNFNKQRHIIWKDLSWHLLIDILAIFIVSAKSVGFARVKKSAVLDLH